jgi:hypothetical protein
VSGAVSNYLPSAREAASMSDETRLASGAGTGAEPAQELPPQRTKLLDALRDRDPRVASMYEAAIRIMDSSELEDALSLAGHAMRELMDRLPQALDLPLAEKSRLFSRLDQLQERLDQAHATSSCYGEDGWTGSIDASLLAVIEAVEVLIEERKEFWPSRTKTAAELMKHLEPGFVPRAEPMAKREAKSWSESHRYFEQVSHHHNLYGELETTRAEFETRVQRIELLLINKLRPPTATDFAEIDTLMATFEAGNRG